LRIISSALLCRAYATSNYYSEDKGRRFRVAGDSEKKCSRAIGEDEELWTDGLDRTALGLHVSLVPFAPLFSLFVT
jgi:hypothetical protein